MNNSSREIVVLGATGSIGQSTLEVIRRLGDGFRVAAVTAHSRWEDLAAICHEFKPRLAVMGETSHVPALREAVNGTGIEVQGGEAGLEQAAALEGADTVITGIVGGSGLRATIEAVKAGKRVGVANKEPFVMAGRIIRQLARQHDCEIIPVDSEHSAIFQCLQGESPAGINKVYLTGSGGPFRTRPPEEMKDVTAAEALDHPTWDMGPKITIDSATMMNKALELMEARWLFDLEPAQVEVIVHPQSIIHSMVEFVDGTVKAQLGFPDMKLPIQYALTFPERAAAEPEYMDFVDIGSLTFEQPDLEKYPALRIGYELLRKQGDVWGTIINAANEVAVSLFLAERIPFTGIANCIERAAEEFSSEQECTIEEILDLDAQVRSFLTKEWT